VGVVRAVRRQKQAVVRPGVGVGVVEVACRLFVPMKKMFR
jgi:hypothetical protein